MFEHLILVAVLTFVCFMRKISRRLHLEVGVSRKNVRRSVVVSTQAVCFFNRSFFIYLSVRLYGSHFIIIRIELF